MLTLKGVLNMLITDREILLLVGIVAIVATFWITEIEYEEEEKELEMLQQSVLPTREFHNETFDEMSKDKVYKW